MAQHVRAPRFAHLTPALWFMFVVAMLLALTAVGLGIYGFLNAGDGGASILLPITLFLMLGVLTPFTVIAQRRRKELEGKQ